MPVIQGANECDTKDWQRDGEVERDRGRIREMKNETYCEKYVQWEWEKRSEKSWARIMFVVSVFLIFVIFVQRDKSHSALYHSP